MNMTITTTNPKAHGSLGPVGSVQQPFASARIGNREYSVGPQTHNIGQRLIFKRSPHTLETTVNGRPRHPDREVTIRPVDRVLIRG
jgi:hypothetical protein